MRIGTAQLDITPPLGRPVIGQLLERCARTIYDPLYVNAVVLGEGDQRVALLSADACSMGNQTVAEVRQLAHEWCGIAPERIFLCATHSHTGPALASALGTNCDEPIRDMF